MHYLDSFPFGERFKPDLWQRHRVLLFLTILDGLC
jgi:hypothetical protein